MSSFLFANRLLLEELLLSGFMAIAWMRATKVQAGTERLSLVRLLKLPGRIERLQRARWQWTGLVALMLVLRLQGQLLPQAELIIALEFILFVAWPSSEKRPARRLGRGHAAVANR